MEKDDFLGKAAIAAGPKELRLFGLICLDGEPKVNGAVKCDGKFVGRITNGARSPYLGKGIGMVLMAERGHAFGDSVEVEGRDGAFHSGLLAEMPLYDKACDIPRGKLVDIPQRA